MNDNSRRMIGSLTVFLLVFSLIIVSEIRKLYQAVAYGELHSGVIVGHSFKHSDSNPAKIEKYYHAIDIGVGIVEVDLKKQFNTNQSVSVICTEISYPSQCSYISQDTTLSFTEAIFILSRSVIYVTVFWLSIAFVRRNLINKYTNNEIARD